MRSQLSNFEQAIMGDWALIRAKIERRDEILVLYRMGTYQGMSLMWLAAKNGEWQIVELLLRQYKYTTDFSDFLKAPSSMRDATARFLDFQMQSHPLFSNLDKNIMWFALRDNKSNIVELLLPYKGDAPSREGLSEQVFFDYLCMATKPKDLSFCKVIADYLNEARSLSYVHISQANLSNYRIRVILNPLRRPRLKITKLSFQECTLDIDGIKELGNFLSTNTTVTTLELRTIKLSDHLLRNLCLRLQENIHLQRLILSDNQITSIGVDYIVELMGRNKNLQEIHLFHNPIGVDGGEKLFKAIRKNDNIIGCYVAQAQFDDAFCIMDGFEYELAEAIYKLARQNQILKNTDYEEKKSLRPAAS